ncbi:hypothetical protein ACH47B_27190 [Rhodococcus sp. NPDC019627]|uniref:hypothetical protein n=1 Tax=unclassified Rhodococcus (in: high G+C Gram-positive bacteria) TaxID=192944 RepID=UPI0033C7A82E
MRPDRAADDKTREFERISHQVVANDQREDLTAGDRAAAVADMLELGFSVTKVAKAVSMPREQVKANGVIGKSEKARAAFEAGQLDMEKAAILAEFFLMWTTHGESAQRSDQLVVGWGHARADREDGRDRVLGGPGRSRW